MIKEDSLVLDKALGVKLCEQPIRLTEKPFETEITVEGIDNSYEGAYMELQAPMRLNERARELSLILNTSVDVLSNGNATIRISVYNGHENVPNIRILPTDVFLLEIYK